MYDHSLFYNLIFYCYVMCCDLCNRSPVIGMEFISIAFFWHSKKVNLDFLCMISVGDLSSEDKESSSDQELAERRQHRE